MTPAALELKKWLVSQVAEHVGMAACDLDVTMPVRTLGLDSAAIAEIAADLGAHLGLEVSPMVFLESPTIAELVSRFTTPMPDAPPAPGAAPPAQHDPIAIVGISARIPGADSVNAMWELLIRGSDPVGPVPDHRWQLPGTALTEAEAGANHAGMLGDVGSFDAGFFRITPAEAAHMDPQQRLLLQGTWEALEDGGLVADALAGSRTGVYVGISNSDYSRQQLGSLDDAHALAPTGSALCVAANRVSYVYDFRGPSVAVDTACSSSLVATHLAVRDLRSGDCEAAIVAGVNLLIEPWASVALARAGLLSPRGRCKSFDASADGYVRAEGCLVVVLKPLATADADGDRIYATILGSHVNQDGRSNGLTAPSPAAQEDLLRRAYANAGVSPSSVQYVECQGTGSLLGDSVEARAVGTVIGRSRDDGRACLIGSIKSNVGHLESAGGIAGLVKCALALHHGYVPGNLHFRSPNPHVDFPGLGLRVAATGQPWPDGPRFAGVSGMGFGGTNAHVVLGEAPPSAQRSSRDRGTGTGHVHVLPLSARHPAALTELTRAMAARLTHADPAELPAIVATASLRRAHHAVRAAVTGASAAELASALQQLPPPAGQLAQDPTAPLVYVFPGQLFPGQLFPGQLFPGQAGLDPSALLEFAERDARVAATLRQCDEILRELAGWSLLQALKRDDASVVLNRPEFVQPAAVATHIALAAMWQGLGLRPGAVVGYGLGEVSAAVVAGVLSLPQAMRVAQVRGEVTSAIPGSGRGMTYAAGKLAASLADIRPSTPAVPFWSTVTGQPATDPLDGAYWARNLRSRVEFAAACTSLLDAGAFAFIELGTRPTLRTAVVQLAEQKGVRGSVYVSTMESQADPVRHVRAGIARLYAAGINPRWDRLVRRPAFAALPTYPWRRERHWLDRAPAQGRARPAVEVPGQPAAASAGLRSIGLGYQGAGQRPELGHDYLGPRNQLEHRIAEVWQRALGFDRIGVEDGFFELGGDSVFGHQVILEVNRSLGVSLDVATVFERFTVARLAELAEADIVQRLDAMSDDDARKMLDMLDEES
jgi:acyl transferase domain-containing protein/acyl carrier protein